MQGSERGQNGEEGRGCGNERDLRAWTARDMSITAGLQRAGGFFLLNYLGNMGMRSVVMKFGGSSVVDAPAIDRVTAIVAAERGRGSAPVVVVSALGGGTDALLALAQAARKGDPATVDPGIGALSRRRME